MRSNNELNHSLKGAMRAGHKYISRTMKNGKWRYTYANKGRALAKKADTMVLPDSGVKVTFGDVKITKDSRDENTFHEYAAGKVSREYVEEKAANGGMVTYDTEKAKRRLDAIDAQKKRQARRQEAIRSKKTAELKAKGRKFIEDAKRAGII